MMCSYRIQRRTSFSLNFHPLSPYRMESPFVKELYTIAMPTDSVARAVLYAIEQPVDVEIDEVVLRPTLQDF